MDLEYTLFLEEHEHALARAEQEFAFLKANLEKQKAIMRANRESFKYIFVEVACFSKELNDASMSEYMNNTDSIRLKRTVKLRQLWLSSLSLAWLIFRQSSNHDVLCAFQRCG